MSGAVSPEAKAHANQQLRRGLRVVGFAALMIGGCAWMTRNDVPFWPAFALQTVAAFYFVALILGAVWLGIVIGAFVGKLNGVLGFIVGLLAGATAFFVVGILSTELPLLGPPLERFVNLIE